MEKIKIGILGYGNLGKGVEAAALKSADMELKAIYTRRPPEDIRPSCPSVPVLSAKALDEDQDIDVLILCGGSYSDLPVQTPRYARSYNVVDSFDDHSRAWEHFLAVDAAARGAAEELTAAGMAEGSNVAARTAESATGGDARSAMVGRIVGAPAPCMGKEPAEDSAPCMGKEPAADATAASIYAAPSGHLALISAGWDPGLFSLNRAIAEAILPDGESCTFWGKGISQGHSDAIRRIDGVKDARQYTVPLQSVLDRVRSGKPGFSSLSPGEKHFRQCFVVTEDGVDDAGRTAIAAKIKSMPAYFADYDTEVNFISEEELRKEHSGMPHGGSVIRSGRTGLKCENRSTVEFKLSLDSNPQFTASVLIAYARAVYRLYMNGSRGCKTVFDIPPALLLPMERKDMIRKLL